MEHVMSPFVGSNAEAVSALCHCLRYPPVARSDIATSISPARASSQPSPSILIATPNVHPQQSLCHLQHFFIPHHLHATRSSTATTTPPTALLHPQQPLFHPWCLPLGSTELPWAGPALGQGAAAAGSAAHQRLPRGTELPFLQLCRDVSCLFPQFIIQLLPPAVCSTDESPTATLHCWTPPAAIAPLAGCVNSGLGSKMKWCEDTRC